MQPHTQQHPPRRHLALLLVVCCSTAATLLMSSANAAALVEHSLDAGQTFSTAGRIHLKETDTVQAHFERDAVTSTQLSQLQQLVESDRLYLWRVTLPDQLPVLTSIKAACIAPAFTAPQYSLHLDSAGHIMSADISVPSAATPGGSCSTSHALQALQALSAADLSDLQDLAVAVHTPKPAPAVPKGPADAAAPDLTAAAGAAQQQAAQQQQQQQKQRQQQQQKQGGQRGSADGKGGEGGEGGDAAPPVDERSWLQKNWLIVMAGATMVLNIVLKNVVDPQGEARAAPPQARGGAQRRIAQ